MKKLLFILMLTPILLMAQPENVKSIFVSDSDQLYRFTGIGTIPPTRSITLSNGSLLFYINFEGDSLMVGGDMPMSKAAELFINFCRKYNRNKIDSLETELEEMRKKYNDASHGFYWDSGRVVFMSLGWLKSPNTELDITDSTIDKKTEIFRINHDSTEITFSGNKYIKQKTDMKNNNGIYYDSSSVGIGTPAHLLKPLHIRSSSSIIHVEPNKKSKETKNEKLDQKIEVLDKDNSCVVHPKNTSIK
jgi:hypothetical protein